MNNTPIRERLSSFRELTAAAARRLPWNHPVTFLSTFAGTLVKWHRLMDKLRATGALKSGRFPNVYLLTIDIGDFKAYARRHGQEASDTLELALALAIRETYGKHAAVLAHWLPGWFQVILPEITCDVCRELSENFLKKISCMAQTREIYVNIAFVCVPLNKHDMHVLLLKMFERSCMILNMTKKAGPGRIIDCNKDFARYQKRNNKEPRFTATEAA